jgi:3-hydroxyisobutyrate dehydrogenase-like beta-hydroxyacid dehydrogenase
MVELGARAPGSSRAVAAEADVVISVVRDAADTDGVIFGAEGVWEGIREGCTIVVSSTVGPGYCRDLYARCRERGIRLVDAAVTTQARSFVPGAESAEFTLFVGGDDDAVTACRPVFEALAKNVFHLGGVGAGQAGKVVNNLAMYANGVVAQECLNLGVKAGLDPGILIRAMRSGTGDSRSLGMLARLLGNHAATPVALKATTSGLDLGTKDRELAFELASGVGASTPVARFMTELDLASVYEALPDAVRARIL